MSRQRNLRLFFAIFGLTALIQVVVASRSGLWADEIFSLAMATGHSLEHSAAAADPTQGDFVQPDHVVQAEEFRRYLKHDNPPASPDRVVRAVMLSDTNPPLYYLLLYGWTLLFGTSDLMVRLFSMACSLACLPLLVAIARRVGGRGAVFPTCALFAFSPVTIYYSTDGRMHSVLWLCVLATTWASLILHQRGGGIAIYMLWIVGSAAGFLTHYFFVFPWLALVAYLLVRPGRLSRLHLAVCLAVAAMLILPWYLELPESIAGWRITKDWLKWRPARFDRLTASGEMMVQFFSGRTPLWWVRPQSNNPALVLFGIAAVAMLWRLRTHIFGKRRLLLWLIFGAACAGPLAFDFVEHTYTVAFLRYAIAALPFAYLLAAIGLACLRRPIRIILLIFIIIAWVPTVLSIYLSESRGWVPIREVSRTACMNNGSSDLILVHSIPSGVLGIARYANGPAPLASWIGQLGTRRVPESIHKLVAGRIRVVFVKVHFSREPAPEEDWLRTNAVVSQETRLGSARIIDFRPLHAERF